MLADALVYGLSLYAIGHVAGKKKKIARLSGYFQLALAMAGFVEVIRRFTGSEQVPDFRTMIVVALLALIANIVTLAILTRSASREVHMKASMIFTSNDIIANAGVIAAGIIVFFSGSRIPDLIIGALVFGMVARGAYRILKLSR
jgi:Co/Zn/Cd efflux system component